jgi:hypothetical protein
MESANPDSSGQVPGAFVRAGKAERDRALACRILCGRSVPYHATRKHLTAPSDKDEYLTIEVKIMN